MKRKSIGTFFRNKVEIGSNKLILAEPEVLADPSLHPVPSNSISQLATCRYSEPGPFSTIF
jgi:hypothetical protein